MFLNAQSDRLSVYADDIAKNTIAGTNDATRAWADYYNVLTSGVREICLENLARAYRAAAFWRLSDIASFKDWVQRQSRRGHGYGARSRVNRIAECPRRRDRRVPPDTWCFSGETNR